MKKRNLENKKLDKIGSNLFNVTKISDEEIEKIVTDPYLFDSIKAKINAEESRLSLEPKSHSSAWDWMKLYFANRQTVLGSFLILFVLVSFTFVFIYKKQTSTQLAKENKTKIESKVFQTVNSLALFEPKENKDISDENSIVKKQITLKNESPKTSKNIQKINSIKPQKISAKNRTGSEQAKNPETLEPDSSELSKEEIRKVFYPLPFSENKTVGSEDLQIIRTELSRSELFALGVNVQLENEAATVKTELLVGMDGVARAIRVVEEF